MIPDNIVRLICPHCHARFVISPEPEEMTVPCPNPSCAKPIELESQIEEVDDYSMRLSRKLWAWIAGAILSVLLGVLYGC